MAFVREAGFWRHHLTVLVAAILIVWVSRSIGLFGDPSALTAIMLQTTILVAIALPLQTICALLGVRFLVPQCNVHMASVLGCTAAALPASALSMGAVWFAGLAHLDPHTSTPIAAFTLTEWLAVSFIPAAVLHCTLGSFLWMKLGYPWWQPRLERWVQDSPALAPDTPSSHVDVTPEVEEKRPTAPPDFMRRLAPHNAGRLLALCAERHYVRVYTETGSELLLMRLSDAIEDCQHLNGMQIHRSCWVHRDAVDRLKRTNGKLEVRLRNGVMLPVARSRQSAAGAFLRNGKQLLTADNRS